jgi:hypothetical protein
MNTDFSRRFDSACKTLRQTAADRQLYNSPEGTELVMGAVKEIFEGLESDLQPYKDDMGFGVIRYDEGASFLVEGPDRLVVLLQYNREREFTQGKNRLKILVGYALFGSTAVEFGEPRKSSSDIFLREDFIPTIGEDKQVLWVTWTDQKSAKSKDLIVDLVTENYLKGIERYVDKKVGDGLL